MRICPVVVGRDAELAVLDAARAQGGGLVLVAGEAGIGKSRLLREFAERARAAKRTVLWARPEAVTRPGPYSLVADMLDDFSTLPRRPDADHADIADLLRLVSEGEQPPARPVAARLRGALGRARCVVLIEDLHHADELSQAVVAHLARSARDDGVLLVATYRSEEAQRESLARLLDLVTRDRIATQIDLSPLGRDDLAAMLEAMWGRAPEPDEVETFVSLGEGIPFFIEELAAARDAGGSGVPASIARAVLTRLQRLEDDEAAVMRIASLMEGALDPIVLATASGIAEADLPRILVASVGAGLLSDQEGRLAFRHALVRDAIAGSIVSVERAELHGRIAEAIEKQAGGDAAAVAPALARHLHAAGERARAAAYDIIAGKRALSAGALDEARAAFDAAVNANPAPEVTLEARVGSAETALRFRQLGDAASLLAEAAEGYLELDRPSEAAATLLRLALAQHADGDVAALETYERAGALVAAHDDALRARVEIEHGHALVRSFSRAAEARPLLEAGRARAVRARDARLLAQAADGLAWVTEFEGDLAAAEREGAEACARSLEARDEETIARVHTDHALRLTMHGRCEDALAALDAARDRFAERMGSLYLPWVESLRAWLLWRMGWPEEAERAASRLEASQWARHYPGVARIWATAERGDLARAHALTQGWWAELGDEEHRRHALAHPEEIPGAPQEIFVLLAELVVRAHEEEVVSEELRTLAGAYDTLCRDGAPDTRMLVQLLHARVLLRTGDSAEASALIDEVATLIGEQPYLLHRATVEELRGLAAPDAAQAAASLDEAARVFAAAGNRSDRARATRLAAERAHAAGAPLEEVVERLRQARLVAAEAGATAEANRAESQLRALGIRPRAGRPKGPRRAPGTLSAREQEVVALVAAGATNAEIAARLFLSDRTVQDHIAKAQRRLSVSGRAGLAAWAAKQGLV